MPNHPYEFGGPLGALGVILGTPFLTYAIYFACNSSGCPSSEFLHAPLETFKTQLWPGWHGFFDWSVTGYYFAYYFGLIAMQLLFPGKTIEGVVLKDGTRLKYKINAFECFTAIILYCLTMTYTHGPTWTLWTFIWSHYLQLITASLLFSILLTTYVYIASYVSPATPLAAGGQTPSAIYNWFIGRPLNPRIQTLGLDIDLKVFSELRPGMILWPLLNFTFLTHQLTAHGRITDSMILVNAFQFWYVADALWNESSVLTTMDVISDGFGFMLSFGDLVWVPIMYSLQARYLALHPVDLGVYGVFGVLAVQSVGYYIFRGANGEKNAFRTNPNDPKLAHLKFIETKSGSKLLVSGWWGMARHVNYLGDWIMAWAWCLPTGFSTPLSYFYVVYFAVLLVHRERRDESKCMDKYGEDWKRYTERVRYRIIPGVY